MFSTTQVRSTDPNKKMKAQEPPNRATPSATRSPKVSLSSTTSLGLGTRRRSSSSVLRKRLAKAASTSRATSGRRRRRPRKGSRSRRKASTPSEAAAVALRPPPSRSETSPKNSPGSRMSTTTFLRSSPITESSTRPPAMM